MFVDVSIGVVDGDFYVNVEVVVVCFGCNVKYCVVVCLG